MAQADRLQFVGTMAGSERDGIVIGELGAWAPNEIRVFSDEYARSHGWTSGSDLADYVLSVYNQGRSSPMFIRLPAEPEAPSPEPVTADTKFKK